MSSQTNDRLQVSDSLFRLALGCLVLGILLVDLGEGKYPWVLQMHPSVGTFLLRHRAWIVHEGYVVGFSGILVLTPILVHRTARWVQRRIQAAQDRS